MAVGAIVDYTERVAGEIAARYGEKPLDELRLWVSIAHQRESMVAQLYELSDIDLRFGATPQATAPGLVRAAMLSIWAHEEKHTQFLGSIRSVSEVLPQLRQWQGQVEGLVTRQAVNGSALARMLIALGSSLGKVPDFARELRRMNLRELLLFHAELESTARMGYERILQLVEAVQASERALADFGYTFRFDIARILCEECFHEEAFVCMADWVAPDGESFMQLSAESCARQLHDLCERHLNVATCVRVAGRQLPENYWPSEPGAWASDGGLGAVFRDYGLPVPVGQGA